MQQEPAPEHRPLLGPQGRWKEAMPGGFITEFAVLEHKPSGRKLPVTISFSRTQGTSHLHNELAIFHIKPDGIYCNIAINLPEVYCGRIQAILTCLSHYLTYATDLDGHFLASLGDEGLCARVLSFCSIIPDYLIPDPYFLNSQGYEAERIAFEEAPTWEERQDCAYWRGTDTGVWRYRKPELAPRVIACLLSRSHPDLIDAAITRIEPRANSEDLKQYYEAMCILGPEEPQNNILNYKYQIDIDGNTSTWSGLFLKMLSGSPVLKVESEYNWKQWYYPKLVPGEHYIPIRPDLSNLIENLRWLHKNPDRAKQIGRSGADFARTVGYEQSLDHATETISRLIKLNNRVPPLEIT